MVEGEESIRSMTTPGDPPTTGISVGSNVTGYIFDILQKIDQIGKVIAEVSRCYVTQPKFVTFFKVHPYAKLAWDVLNAAQRVSNLSIL